MLSKYASTTILNAMCGRNYGSFFSGRSYMALSSTIPTSKDENGAYVENVTEPVGNGYERTLIGYYNQNETMLMGDPEDGVISNVKEIHFTEATGDWGELPYICIYDAKTAGHLIAWGELGKTVEGVWQKETIHPIAETVVVLKAGDVRISII